MKFTIVVHSAPYSSEASRTALEFCKSVISEGHEIYRLFFFRDGVGNLNKLAVVALDEQDIRCQWDKLITQNKLDAIACVTSALKRGVIDEKEAQRYEKPAFSLTKSASIGGLGQLVDAALKSDRLLNFG